MYIVHYIMFLSNTEKTRDKAVNKYRQYPTDIKQMKGK